MKVDLGEGDYAIILDDLIHKTVRELNEAHKTSVDDEKDFIIISRNQISEWSFGEFTQENIDKIPERKLSLIKEAILKQYSPLAPTSAKN